MPGGPPTVEPWPVKVPESWPALTTQKSENRGLGWSMQSWFAANGDFGYDWTRIAYGLPCDAMSMNLRKELHFEGGPSSYQWVSALMIPGIPLRVPMKPVWSGIALNSGLYSAVLVLVTFGPGIVRRRRRRRRGLCVACGYELKGMQKCPECGS
jgi:hypothetical protein